MARGIALSQLLEDLKHEVGHSIATGAGGDADARLKYLLKRKQAFLYDDYDWRFLHDIVTATASASGRFITFPTDTSPETIDAIYRLEGGSTIPLLRGISIEHYGIHNSLAGTPEEADPIRRFDYGDDGGTAKIELWPIPATDATLYFDNKRPLGALSADNDTADLDDQLIVLFTAVDILKRAKHADWEDKLGEANARYVTLKTRYKPAGPPVLLADFDPHLEPTRPAPVIRVNG